LFSWSLIFGVLFGCLIVASGIGYLTYDYTQNNPKFCITCHDLMIESYETWQTSEHADVNCHSCHYFTPEYAINFPLGVIKSMPKKIPERPEGKVIVPDKYCMECHWDGEEQHGDAGEWAYWIFPKTHAPENANKVTNSRFHALHYFMGPTACSTCHGGKELHVFTSKPGDCLDCHEDKAEKIHMIKTGDLACLNCHTDQTVDLNPNQEKCLACHSADTTIREQLVDAGTIDAKYAPPAEEMIAQAAKITLPEGMPMQSLNCSACHRSHPEEKIEAGETCISCHSTIESVGEHTRHIPYYQSNCLKCHQQHEWSIDEEWAQQECAKCHPYETPFSFVAPKQEI
jgi:hypothetical protein